MFGMSDSIMHLIQWIFTSLIVGGALWKGLDSVANALAKRAEAIMTERRLDFDQMQANYTNAMSLLDQQAERIETLHDDITAYEGRITKLINDYERRLESREMEYIEKIKVLQRELDCVRRNYAELLIKYNQAIERIKKLEKGDTGPLRDSNATSD